MIWETTRLPCANLTPTVASRTTSLGKSQALNHWLPWYSITQLQDIWLYSLVLKIWRLTCELVECAWIFISGSISVLLAFSLSAESSIDSLSLKIALWIFEYAVIWGIHIHPEYGQLNVFKSITLLSRVPSWFLRLNNNKSDKAEDWGRKAQRRNIEDLIAMDNLSASLQLTLLIGHYHWFLRDFGKRDSWFHFC